jgi:hypothetical protein
MDCEKEIKDRLERICIKNYQNRKTITHLVKPTLMMIKGRWQTGNLRTKLQTKECVKNGSYPLPLR